MPIFQDHFLNNRTGWAIRDDKTARTSLKDGDCAYTIEGRSKDSFYVTWHDPKISGNEPYKIHIVLETLSTVGNMGLAWRLADTKNCCVFLINTKGKFAIFERRNGDSWETKHKWTSSTHIRKGNGAFNELMIRQFKTKVIFMINNQEVATVSFLGGSGEHKFGFYVEKRAEIRVHSCIMLNDVEPPLNLGKVSVDRSEAVKAALDEFNTLVGMENIKQEVQTFVNFIRVQQLREEYDLVTTPLTYHMVLMGPPGTGKTTVARLIGKLYKALGILSKGHLVETDRAGLVAAYVGQTALKVEKKVEEALGGVLFIDEAYALAPNDGKYDYGKEATEALLKRMEDLRGEFAVIIAGYPNEMNRFLDGNPGLRSRFNRYLQFEHYKPAELVAIFEVLAEQYELQLTGFAKRKLRQHLNAMHLNLSADFGNGRYVRSLLEKAIERQANRVVSSNIMNKRILQTLREEDIPTLVEVNLF